MLKGIRRLVVSSLSSPALSHFRHAALVGAGIGLAVGLVAPGCTISRCSETQCCRSCDDEQPRRACSCTAAEKPAYLCPNRSACALAFHVGDGPASCCRGTCAATEVYEDEGGRCADADRYLHECTVDSPCFQSHLAQRAGTTFLPWHEETTGSGAPLYGLWAAGPEDAWAVGTRGTILHRDASGWSTFESPVSENLAGVWGSAKGSIWAVGWSGTILRYDGDRWSTVSSPTSESLNAVWGSGDDDVWAVGSAATILHWNGSVWQTEVASEAQGQLLDVAGRPGGDVFIVGQDGLVLRREADGWTREDSPTQALLASVWVTSEGAWAAGSGGTVLRRRDGRWLDASEILAPSLTSLWGDAGELWAVGAGGVILLHQGNTWEQVSYFPGLLPFDLLAVWGTPERIWAAGGGGGVLVYEKPLP